MRSSIVYQNLIPTMRTRNSISSGSSILYRHRQPHPSPSDSIHARTLCLLHSKGASNLNESDAVVCTGIPVRWPVSKIESRGRYQDECFLEDVIGGRLYEKQSDLPSLPVMECKDTVTKLLESALPLSESEEETSSFILAVQDFEDEALELQQKLRQRYDETKVNGTSWLSDWWNQIGYLKYREPVVINVSYFFHLNDDPTIRSFAKDNLDLRSMRAASILVAAATFRKDVCTGNLKYESVGVRKAESLEMRPLCSVAYKYMFHACRIPSRKDNMDSYTIYDPSRYRHCIIACKGHFFKMNFIHEHSHEPLPLKVIENRLMQIISLAENAGRSQHLGILTSDHRDIWADKRAQLVELGAEDDLEDIQSGAIVICLDDETPTSRTESAKLFWHGGESSGFNRWFDKSVQIVCTKNGQAGLIGEHSMMDGMPTFNLCKHIYKNTYGDISKNEKNNSSFVSLSGTTENNGTKFLFQNLSQSKRNEISSLVKDSEESFLRLINMFALNAHDFRRFGSVFIKNMGYSPDAFVQQAIQLASYKLFGKQVATYEATQVRPFRHGRTETTRSVSKASEAFVKSMDIGKSSKEKLIENLRNASDYHAFYSRAASEAQGIDRHLFGLEMIQAMNMSTEKQGPKLFSHPLYQRSKRWRLSTSTLPIPPGFGPVVDDGIGIGYFIDKQSVYFCITSRKEQQGVLVDWTKNLERLLDESLEEMVSLHESSQGIIPRSRL